MKGMNITSLAVMALAAFLCCTPKPEVTEPQTPVDKNPDKTETAQALLRAQDGKVLSAFGVNFQTPLSWEANRLNKAGVPKTAQALNAVTDNNIDDIVLMGANHIRCHLTPADFTDEKGNLQETAYLDALDYLVYRAAERNIYVSFAFLNHMGSKGPGDSWTGKGDRTWIHDPAVVECTKTYVKALLEHRNRYNSICYKDMPHLAYWELINEPQMYSYEEIVSTEYYPAYRQWLEQNSRQDSKLAYSDYRRAMVKAYVDGMVDLVRSTGDRHPVCWGLNWHRFRRDNADIFAGISASKADVVAFCNYPGQDYVSQDYWNGKRYDMTERSFAPWFNEQYKSLNGYGWALTDEFASKAKVVYEFETFFNQSAYIYPIQALYFRALKAQAASMWTYTFNEIARYHGGSHFLNLRYTPSKAASFIVASHIFATTPMGGAITVEDEMKSQLWCISKSHDAAVYSDADYFCHSGSNDQSWTSLVPSPTVKHVCGVGSSPAASYSGSGVYFIDETQQGLSIILMPDISIEGDRFSGSDYKTVVTRLVEDKVNTLKIKVEKWASKAYTLYEMKDGAQVKLMEIGSLDTLELKAGKYVLIKK